MVNAQTALHDSSTGLVRADNSLYIYKVFTVGTVKGTDTLASRVFPRGEFDSTFSIYSIFTNAHDSIKMRYALQHSPNGYSNWTTLRIYSDSVKVNTLQYKEDTMSEVTPYYRLVFWGLTGNGYTTWVKAWAYVRRE